MTVIKNPEGLSVLCDGQFGSTGKGLAGAYVAHHYGDAIDGVITNAGPNSGHTFYVGDQQVVLKQLPTIAVYAKKALERDIPVWISGGAVVDPDILIKEMEDHDITVYLNRQAAIIRQRDKDFERSGSIARVAGTRQGVGAAQIRKILRDETAVVKDYLKWPRRRTHLTDGIVPCDGRRWMEISQGFSLGINSEFYPKVTSRECTVMQGMADARINPHKFKQCVMTIRTYPIRVGNVDGHSSGYWYPDQTETTWEALGIKPEVTTVTGRVRRVATFSEMQYAQALLANGPSVVFVNFMNYLPDENARRAFVKRLVAIEGMMGMTVNHIYGFGPRITDITETL